MKTSTLFLFLAIFVMTAYPQFTQDKTGTSDFFTAGKISVTLGGTFPINGTFPALVTDRVDEFITRMYSEAVDLTLRITSDPEIYRKLKQELSNYALRGIRLKRANGEELIVDIQKFRMNGDFSNNPYLKNDDVIVFPSNDVSRNFFAVSGVVNNAGTFLFVEGDKLGDALELVDGINPAYENVDSVEVSRLSYDGQTQVITRMKIEREVEIQCGDRFRFIAPETQRKNYAVTVIGEVNMPGVVPISKNRTTLYEVLLQSIVTEFDSSDVVSKVAIFLNSKNTVL